MYDKCKNGVLFYTLLYRNAAYYYCGNVMWLQFFKVPHLFIHLYYVLLTRTKEKAITL